MSFIWSSTAALWPEPAASVIVVEMRGLAVAKVWPASARSLCSAATLPVAFLANVSKHTR